MAARLNGWNSDGRELSSSSPSFAVRSRRLHESRKGVESSQEKIQKLLQEKNLAWTEGEIQKLTALQQSPSAEDFAQNFLAFARQLKSGRQWAKAAFVLGNVAQDPQLPEGIKNQAEKEFNSLSGSGSFGMRFEVLTGQFAEQATDAKTIAPMLGASMLGQIVGAWTLGRLAATPSAGWLTRGLGARLAAGSAGFLAEFPVFAGMNRALTPVPEGSFADDLKRSALTLGSLRVFNVGANLVFARPFRTAFGYGGRSQGSPLQSLSTFLGLMTAHKLEERFGLRPHVDGATTVTDTLAAMVSLGVGSHLGKRVLGPRFAAFQQEMGIRTQNATPGPGNRYPGVRQFFAASGRQAAIVQGGNELPRSEKPLIAPMMMAIMGTDAPYPYHGLSVYRDLAKSTLMGDPLIRIREMIDKKKTPVRILDIGSGDGRAVREIKERFREKVVVETNDLEYASLPDVDHHHRGDFLTLDLEGDRNLIFAVYGAPSYHEGRLLPMLQKAAELLAPEGEFVAALTHESLAGDHGDIFARSSPLPAILNSIEKGLLLRFEKFSTDGGLLYMKRLGSEKTPKVEELLRYPSPITVTDEQKHEMEKKLLGVRFATEDGGVTLGYPYVPLTADLFAKTGSRDLLDRPEAFAQKFYEIFVSEWRQKHARTPNASEIEEWIGGSTPSPLMREAILIDQVVQLRLAEKAVPPPQIPASPPHVDRRLAALLSHLKGYLDAIPAAVPERVRIRKALDGLSEKLKAGTTEQAFRERAGEIERQTEEVLLNLQGTSLRSLRETLRPLLVEISDRAMQNQWRRLIKRPEIPAGAWEAHEDFRETYSLFLDAAKALIKSEWEGTSSNPIPQFLSFSLGIPLANLYFLNLLQTPLSPSVLRDFISEAVRFYRDYPPGEDEFLGLQPEGRATPHNFLLGSNPTADSFLEAITLNLRGHRRLFGNDAGPFFHGEAVLVSELGSTGYFLVADKGQNEFSNGLRLALFKEHPRSNDNDNYLAKVGIHFGPEYSLRIVNIQGAVPDLFDRKRELQQLQEILGGASALEMLVAAAILLGKNLGFSRVEGIKDGAQIARADGVQARPAGFYDLYFRKFGFRPPETNQDYWTLNLQDFPIYRRKPSPSEQPISPLTQIEREMPRDSGQYFHEILQRAQRDANGGRLRPRDWDALVPAKSAGAVRAFWEIMAPAISRMTWQSAELGPGREYSAVTQRPFQFRNLTQAQLPAPPYFSQALWLSENQPSALDTKHLELYRRILRGGVAGRIPRQRALHLASRVIAEDWIEMMKSYGAVELRYPIEILFDGLDPKRNPGLEWIGRWLEGSSGRKEVVEIKMDPAAYQRFYDAHAENTSKVEFIAAVLGLLAKEMGLQEDTFYNRPVENGRTFRLPSEDLMFEGTEWMSGDQAISFQEVPDLVSEEEAHRLMDNDTRPVVIASHAMEIHNTKNSHPVAGLFHDHYHRFKLSRLSRQDRQELVQLYVVFKALSGSYEFLEGFVDTLLDGDLGGVDSHRSLFTFIRAAGPDDELKKKMHQKLIEQFSGTERGRKIIQTFEKEVLGLEPSDPDDGGGSQAFLAGGSLALLIGVATTLSLLAEPALAHAAFSNSDKLSENPSFGLPAMAWIGGIGLWQGIKTLFHMYWDDFLIRLGWKAPLDDPPPALPKVASHVIEGNPQNDRQPRTISIFPARKPEKPKAEPRRPGWVKRDKAELDKILNDKSAAPGEKGPAARVLVADFLSAEFGDQDAWEISRVLWDLSVDPRLSQETRDYIFDTYLGFLNNDPYFFTGSPQVYREAFRLRRIFAQAKRDLEKRTKALQAYIELVDAMDPTTTVGSGEWEAGGNVAESVLKDEAGKKTRENREHVLFVSRLKLLKGKLEP